MADMDTILKVGSGAALTFLGSIVSGIFTRQRLLARGTRAVSLELDHMEMVLNTNTELLVEDSAAATRNQEVVQYLTPLPTAALDGANTAGVFEHLDNDLPEALRALATQCKFANARISSREIYMTNNSSMNNYNMRRPMINEILARQFQATDTNIQVVRSAIAKLGWRQGGLALVRWRAGKRAKVALNLD